VLVITTESNGRPDLSTPAAQTQKTLLKAFNKAFAHGFAAFALAAGASASAQTAEAKDNDGFMPIDAYAVQAALQDSARSKFTDLLRATDPAGYGARLTQLEERLNGYLKSSGSDNKRHNSVVVLNPAEIDLNVILDGDLGEMIRTRVAARHGQVHDDRLAFITPLLKDTMVTAGGTGTFTQAPMASMQKPDAEPATCVIIPAPEHDKPYAIPGLSARQMEDYLNLHEGWHCLDGIYGATDDEKKALNESRNLRDVQASLPAQRALASINLQEGLADVAAAGDMIRAGASPAILRHIIAWRAGPTEMDTEHNTVAVLQALEKHIHAVGLDTFRKTGDDAARQLYFKLTDGNGLTQPRLQAALGNLLDNTLGSGARPADASPLQAYYNQRMGEVSAMIDRGGWTPAPADAAQKGARIRKGIGTWDARQTLEREALRQHGEITVESLVYAYGRLKQGLQRGIEAGQNAEVKHEQLSRLRIELVLMATDAYDFTAANSRHGVTLRPSAAAQGAATPPPPK